MNDLLTKLDREKEKTKTVEIELNTVKTFSKEELDSMTQLLIKVPFVETTSKLLHQGKDEIAALKAENVELSEEIKRMRSRLVEAEDALQEQMPESQQSAIPISSFQRHVSSRFLFFVETFFELGMDLKCELKQHLW